MSEEKQRQQRPPVDPENKRATSTPKENPIIKLIDSKERVTFEFRNGRIITGQVCAYKMGMISLHEVRVHGADRESLVLPWVLIDRSAIWLIYPAAEEKQS